MKITKTSARLAFSIWMLTSLFVTMGIMMLYVQFTFPDILSCLIVFIIALLLSLPAFLLLLFLLPSIDSAMIRWQYKFLRLVFLLAALTSCYGLAAAVIDIPWRLWQGGMNKVLQTSISVFLFLFICSVAAVLFRLKPLANYFSKNETGDFSYSGITISLFQPSSKIKQTMETTDYDLHFQPRPEQQPASNKLVIKGVITGVLILLMLIPTIFINNIITEREQRQKEVVKEVSSKWATAQTISGPFLVAPYADTLVTSDGKITSVKKQLVLLASDLTVKGKILPEERPRSIYKVLLYKTNLEIAGVFKPKWPADINPANIDFANVKLCFGISDFKGIEKEITVNFNKETVTLSPGLPLFDLGRVGLAAPVSAGIEAITAGIAFNFQVNLKGSEQLHFMPLAANSRFTINSDWPNPSFDGNALPDTRQVTGQGFTANWNFNQANLPFGTVLKPGNINLENLAFGVSMVQPADQYNKTMRSVKYAILFIGLTFALFFIIEVMQHRPFHPVQYVLVGLALVIFYSLLLSISEYILFDSAYLIAASATVTLISLYAKSHFKSWKTAAVFFTTLGLLYGFIFILIRLEDTALLVGSIGLFIVLALVMYASRKIEWYGGKEGGVDRI